MKVASLMKLLQEKNGFGARHPKFVGFLGEMMRSDLRAGDKIRISVLRGDGSKAGCEMVVAEEDVSVLNEMGNIFK